MADRGGIRIVFLPCKEFSKDGPTCILAENFLIIYFYHLFFKQVCWYLTSSLNPHYVYQYSTENSGNYENFLLHLVKSGSQLSAYLFALKQAQNLAVICKFFSSSHCSLFQISVWRGGRRGKRRGGEVVKEDHKLWQTGQSLLPALSGYKGGKFFWMGMKWGVKEWTNNVLSVSVLCATHFLIIVDVVILISCIIDCS